MKPSSRLVGFDAAPVIYFLEGRSSFAPSAKQWFIDVEKGKYIGLVSTLLITEVLTGFRKRGDRRVEADAQRYFDEFPNLQVIEVTRPIAERATTLRAKYGLRTPDAIHLATAIESGAKTFVTADRKLATVKGLKVIVLGQ